MTIVLGILAAQIVNWLIAEPIPAGSIASDIATSWNGQMAWRWMFWAAAVPSLAFLLMAFFIPESPRWQAMNGQVVAATDTLTRIGGVDYAHTEMRAISIANSAIKEQAGGRLRNRSYDDKRGIRHQYTEIEVENMEFLTPRTSVSSTQSSLSSQQTQTNQQSETDLDNADKLPF